MREQNPHPPPSLSGTLPGRVASPTMLLPIDPRRPLEVDVGCGLGHFLMCRAASLPGTQFVGIERMIDRVRRFNRKIERSGLTNVQVLRADAVDALDRGFAPAAIDRLYVLFPDPWPKRRHHRRRLFDDAFLDLLACRLKPAGEVHVATDHLDYLTAIRQRFETDARFRAIPPMARAPEAWTRFEQLFREQGLPIGDAAYRFVTATDSGG